MSKQTKSKKHISSIYAQGTNAPSLRSYIKISSHYHPITFSYLASLLCIYTSNKQSRLHPIIKLPDSEHLFQRPPGHPILEPEARCRPTTAWMSMLQAWLGNRLSPSAWLKTRAAGIPGMWGLTPTLSHMSSRRREHVVCVSKWAWIPISYMLEGGFFSNHHVPTCPLTARFQGGSGNLFVPHFPFKFRFYILRMSSQEFS